MTESLSRKFGEYSAAQNRAEESKSLLREDLSLLQNAIVPFFESLARELEHDLSATTLEEKVDAAIQVALDEIEVSYDTIDDIVSVTHEVALLDNQDRNAEQALDNFRYHLEKFVELKYDLIEKLKQ